MFIAFLEIIQKEVLDQIGMTESTFEQPLSPERDQNATRAHDGNGQAMDAKWHVYPELAAAGLQALHEHLLARLRGEGVAITGVYYCPHYADGKVERYAVACDCRKPEPGMLLRAAREHSIDLERSWMIGDRPAED